MKNDVLKEKARRLLETFTGDRYVHGMECLDQTGSFCSDLGARAMVVTSKSDATWARRLSQRVQHSLTSAGIQLAADRVFAGVRPNAPREDMYRLEAEILQCAPDFIVAVGGGSTIDAVKAANALATCGVLTNDIEDYFGVGKVGELLRKAGNSLRPVCAVQVAAGSGAHLTKYSNITDPVTGQKKLIVDPAIVPQKALFDYAVTTSAPVSLTLDGAMDGIAHCLEVYYGAKDNVEQVREIALTGIELAIVGLKLFMADQSSLEARELLGLATDLGGYAIMVGGTNGAHLTSFSLVNILSHGRACALLNPYYTAFFAPAIESKLRDVGELYRRHGFIESDLTSLSGQELGRAVARGMIAFSASVGFPTTLAQVEGFSDSYIHQALAAAKNPQLEMKLRNMPVPLNASLVDDYMGPILRAAKTGDLSLIRT